jgi:hypothetical protein
MSIEIKDGNWREMWVTFYCPECEEEFGVPCELTADYTDRTEEERKKRIKKIQRFDAVHERCGMYEVEERLQKRFPAMYSDEVIA